MVIYGEDKEGNIIVVFDSRWRFPELLGYSPDDPQYKMLQRLWEQTTGKRIPGDEPVPDKPVTSEHEGKR